MSKRATYYWARSILGEGDVKKSFSRIVLKHNCDKPGSTDNDRFIMENAIRARDFLLQYPEPPEDDYELIADLDPYGGRVYDPNYESPFTTPDYSRMSERQATSIRKGTLSGVLFGLAMLFLLLYYVNLFTSSRESYSLPTEEENMEVFLEIYDQLENEKSKTHTKKRPTRNPVMDFLNGSIFDEE